MLGGRETPKCRLCGSRPGSEPSAVDPTNSKTGRQGQETWFISSAVPWCQSLVQLPLGATPLGATPLGANPPLGVGPRSNRIPVPGGSDPRRYGGPASATSPFSRTMERHACPTGTQRQISITPQEDTAHTPRALVALQASLRRHGTAPRVSGQT